MTVIGARPQFIKAAAFSSFLSANSIEDIDDVIVHTGQHYDSNMSSIFFEELGIPRPTYTLTPPRGTQGVSTGGMMAQLDPIVASVKPDLVLVYGDTNSTLAAALTAVKQEIPVAHVEAGMRSRNMRMPEEVNRVLTDRISALNLAPSHLAFANLQQEGLGQTARLVGDIMFDAVKLFSSQSRLSKRTQDRLRISPEQSQYVLATIHRKENTDSPKRLEQIFAGIQKIAKEIPVILPVHPRLEAKLRENTEAATLFDKVTVVPAVSYLEMLFLQKHAQVVLTDSGGVQKEAFYLGVPCVTLRNETEWPETVALGWNRLVNADSDKIFSATSSAVGSIGMSGTPYGNGDTASSIVSFLRLATWTDYFSTKIDQTP